MHQLSCGGIQAQQQIAFDVHLPSIHLRCLWTAETLSKGLERHFKGCQTRALCRYTCMAFLSCQGSWPVHSSHRITPNEYTSLFSLYAWLRSTSGAVHSGVPAWDLELSHVLRLTLDRPKSQTCSFTHCHAVESRALATDIA